MNYNHLLLIFLFATFFATAQQSMEPGFELLETGKFEKAETFFLEYLNTDPNNKTAQICYGRAVGLSGEPIKANKHFASMLQQYPADFEIQINYNESFLWAGRYIEARPLYKKLVEAYPESFEAVLGYANTFSNLREYDKALQWVDKALTLQPGNASAKTSRKYTLLGKASELIAAQDYTAAKKLFQLIFNDFPEDKDTLLNLANMYLITKDIKSAKAIYQRYAAATNDTITALNGIALAEHIMEKDKNALATATLSMDRIHAGTSPELRERTNERYVQALIWNRKFKRARLAIAALDDSYEGLSWLLALKATFGMYTANFKNSLAHYHTILARDSTSFDGNLGQANALFALDRIVPAYKAAFKTLEVYNNQQDALGFLEKLNAQYNPSIEEHAAYTFDNGNNVALYSITTVDVPFSAKFRTTLSYQYRTTENTVTNNKADAHVVIAGIEYKLAPRVHLKTVFGLNNARFVEEMYTQPVLDIRLKTQPYRLQNLELGYQREVQNFNADLIEREIVMNHYGLNYNLATNFNLGWYTQLMRTEQTDNNSRNLLFTSLYYNILRKPALKMGLNYQYIGFADQVPTIYFSPEDYRAVEVFGDLRGKIWEKTSYIASAATGYQKVEKDPKTTIFRAEASLMQQFSKRLVGSLYGKYSNIASATASGFEFTEIGFKLKWLFTKEPIFYAKLTR
ncbi:tetratricopeptide repeat protein [Spongiimicrobium sp. 3-5]|uniref:tetratricopeptide repeat protein n=1 Tax=Spongiimicrobium sp. 3-5 TaxID=3332596 RepID=UPI00397ED6C8